MLILIKLAYGMTVFICQNVNMNLSTASMPWMLYSKINFVDNSFSKMH